MFWTNTITDEVLQAHLSNGSNTTVIMSEISTPSKSLPCAMNNNLPALTFVASSAADLAVDWINNKLYVTAAGGGAIIEYDLVTEQKRVVIQTGSSSWPSGIVVYPYPNYGYGGGILLFYCRL